MQRVNLLGVLLSLMAISSVGCTAAVAAPLPSGYAPIIKPVDFVQGVTNPYYPLKPGATFIYRGVEKGATSWDEHYVTHMTKNILGVTCVVIRDKVWLNGRLVEDTWDWYTQDRHGNVWYFGEATTQLKNGVVLGHVGSWQAGVHGAKPGIIMPAQPRIGQPYRQEYLRGIAEDMALAVNLKRSASVSYGSFHNVLVTREWSPIDPAAAEYKYYAPGVGFVLLTAAGESQELVQITHD